MAVQELPVVWDLSDLYTALDDPGIQGDLDRLRERAAAFEARFRGRIAAADCTAERLREALDEYEEIVRRQVRPGAYASLTFSADTSDPARGALLEKVRTESTAVSVRLIFFPLEIGRMPEETFRALLGAEELAPYRHYLEHERLQAAHYLSEPEEKVVEELANTGSRAFRRLCSEITSRAVFRVDLDGEVREMTQAEALSLLHDPDREVRRAAAAGVTAQMQAQAHPVTFIYNTLLQHKATMDRLRGYDFPEQSRHLDNELPPEVVERLVEVVTGGFPVVADYYRLKARLLGIDALTHYDRYAPVGEAEARIPFAEAREIVLESFGGFDARLRKLAEPFFTRRWIDAELRPGKRGGAFCSFVTPDLHPYVFMNYTGRVRDVMTLAHEMGHAVHAVLSGKQNQLEFHATLPLAETASVFGEMLVFERLQQQLANPADRLALLCGKLEDTFATVFRQVSMYRFEQAAHRARREEGELTTERLNGLWQARMQEMFGDSLTLGDDHAWWWLYIPHVINTPFYVYAYAFGELLVLALYARYKAEGRPFVDRYFDLLAAGGSRKPEEMLAELNVEIRSRNFWQGGVDLIRTMVEEAKAAAG
jgi:oligoendopeptidase F